MAISVPVRSNGQSVTHGWFNTLRTALLSLFGEEGSGETSFTIANNQSSAADVTGLLVTSAASRSALVSYDIKRKTDTGGSEVRARGSLAIAYRDESTAWAILGQDEFGDAHGVTFSITSAGQVQYQSTNISGSNYVGELKFRVETFND